MKPEFQKEKHISITKNTFEMMVKNVMEDFRPYLKTEGEMVLGTNVAHLVIKMNAMIIEYEELRKGYMDLCKANDEHKKLFLEIAKKQKSLNNYYTKKLRTIEKKLP
tara:strand:+ start:268 stop:588 length:321 start_codon:yes stop_codon:yes gene_type:complete